VQPFTALHYRYRVPVVPVHDQGPHKAAAGTGYRYLRLAHKPLFLGTELANHTGAPKCVGTAGIQPSGWITVPQVSAS
jgi:hypothetical protein